MATPIKLQTDSYKKVGLHQHWLWYNNLNLQVTAQIPQASQPHAAGHEKHVIDNLNVMDKLVNKLRIKSTYLLTW